MSGVSKAIVQPLLSWYDAGHRDLPWRSEPAPYRVWVSEIMLQQTRVEAVRGYFSRWMNALPDIPALAAADEAVYTKLWEGLGYYSRVRNLHRAAVLLCEEYGGILWNVSSFHPRWLEIAFAVIGNSVLIGVFLMLFQSVIKKIKDGSFWKHTIVGRIIWHAYDAAKASEGVFWKLMAVLIGGMLLSATWFGIIPVLILILIFVPKWAKKYTAIKEGVSKEEAEDIQKKLDAEGAKVTLK